MTRPFLLGLTGSIGMGKSTAAAMLAEMGLPVWDADAAVHTLYEPGGAAVAGIAALCPGAVAGGAVSRDQLKDWIAADPGALARIEAVVHPLVQAHRAGFIAGAAAGAAAIIVLDIPLLFETGAEKTVDATLVVTAPPEVQRARVIARPGMTEEHFARILARQMPDAVKRARADYVVETLTPASTRVDLGRVLEDIGKRHA